MSKFIIGSNYIKGDDNTQIIIGNDTELDWEAIGTLLSFAQKKSAAGTEASELLHQASAYCKTKNKSGLVNLLSEHAASFFSGTMQTLLGGVLTQVLMGLLA